MENKYFSANRKMIKIQRKHRALINSEVSVFGIHTTHHRALMYIARKGSLLSQKELALHLEITQAAVTKILQKLELDGFIERKLGSDNRFNEIMITESGQKIVEESKMIFSDIDETIFRGFSDEEMNEFTAYLDRIYANLKGDENNEALA